ncbi:MAG: GIY-YIG nuclease family protein [Verrucomicrobiota bacterium]
MAKNVSKEDIELLDELGVETAPKKQAARTPREQRIIAGYEEIERFVEEQGRLPEHGESRDIFERLYAVRLERLRYSKECRDLLEEINKEGLLSIGVDKHSSCIVREDPTDYEILEALGVDEEKPSDITELKHVRSAKEKLAAEEIAQRIPCRSFGVFKTLFAEVRRQIDDGQRKVVPHKNEGGVHKGNFFILAGQLAYIADWGEEIDHSSGQKDRRLRVIFDNGTESNLLLRSLQKDLGQDKTSRRVTDPALGPLFSDQEEADDQTVGYVYVLRSKSENAFIGENRNVIHKIGITKGSVKKRVANAAKDPTYLLADVEIVETYKVSNLDLNKLEKLLHRFFDAARLDLQLKDRFGFDVEPREWFLVPLPVIEEAIQKLIDGTLPQFCYEAQEGEIVKRES